MTEPLGDGPSEGIRHLIALYCQRCDDGDFDGFADLFLPHAEFVVMGRTHVGATAIRAFMEGAQPPERRGKHITSNTVVHLAVEVENETASASVCTDYLFIDKSLHITSAGRYVDRVERDAATGAWRFARREIQFLGA